MKIEKYMRGSYRFYNIHDKYDLPSVTTILGLLPKPKLIFWAVANTIKFLKARGDLSKASTSLGYVFHKKLLDSLSQEGTNIHNIIQAYILKGKDSDHNALARYKKFELQSGFKCDLVEHVVWDHEEYKSAGTTDLIGSCSHIKILFDIKTSKAIRLSHKIQTCIYKDMYCKQNKLDRETVKSGIILIPRVNKKKWEVYINTSEEEIIFRKIFNLLSKLFYILMDIGDLELT